MGEGLHYMSMDDSEAAAVLKPHPSTGDNSGKLELWCSLSDILGSLRGEGC